MAKRTAIYAAETLGAYGYEEKPWFRPHERLAAFVAEMKARGLDRALHHRTAPPATDTDLELFHSRTYVEQTTERCATNTGALDHGPTFARTTVEHAARHVAGAVLDAARKLMEGEHERAFIPIAGFHHAGREHARNYCLYNDPALALSWLLEQGVAPIAYADIDVHFGDGVYDAFARDPRVITADLHQAASTLFPHTPENPGKQPLPGDRGERGEGPAEGTKLNLALRPGATDADFLAAWAEAEAHLERAKPELIILEAGADGLAGDPLANLALTPHALGEVTRRLVDLAKRHARGRILVLGGGGYDTRNLAAGWCAVLEALIAA